MPEFESRDPREPGFWDERFDRGFTPWDRGVAPQAFRRFVDEAARPLVALIPGCGTAYELAYLCERGWDATAIDFSPSAVAAARRAAPACAGRVVLADFFSYQPPLQLQLVYERAFLCAMPRAMWPGVAGRWTQLLSQGGLLAGYFFFDDAPKGPPFGIARAQLDELLQPHFHCIADEPVSDSIDVFVGKERWMIWRRR
jgi:SAM-dependent methyltransferase